MSPPQCLYLMRWSRFQQPSSFPRSPESRGYMKPQRTVEWPGSGRVWVRGSCGSGWHLPRVVRNRGLWR